MWPHTDRDVQRVLAIRLDNIGDIVMLGPALRTLRANLPQSRITLMASPAGSQVAPLLPWIDEVMVHRAVWQDASGSMPFDPAREQAFIQDLQARRFDAAVIFTSFAQSAYPPASACYLAGIPIRIGQSKEFGGSILTQWVRSLPDESHQVDRSLHLLQSAGFAIAGRHLELYVPEETRAAADQLLHDSGIEPGEPYLVLAPKASCPARTYDARSFAQVAAQIAAELQQPVVVTGGTRDTEWLQPLFDTYRAPRVVSLVGKTSIPELCAVIERASLLIASHSGPMHIADAFRRPMVILFSGTDRESQWRPRSAPHVLLRQPTDCAPCYLLECRYQMECLRIAPEAVADRALALYHEAAPI